MRASATASLPLGNPVLTQPQPTTSVALLTDRDRFIPAKDVTQNTPQTSLILVLAVNVSTTNGGAAAINFQVTANLIYTRLDGLTE